VSVHDTYDFSTRFGGETGGAQGASGTVAGTGTKGPAGVFCTTTFALEGFSAGTSHDVVLGVVAKSACGYMPWVAALGLGRNDGGDGKSFKLGIVLTMGIARVSGEGGDGNARTRLRPSYLFQQDPAFVYVGAGDLNVEDDSCFVVAYGVLFISRSEGLAFATPGHSGIRVRGTAGYQPPTTPARPRARWRLLLLVRLFFLLHGVLGLHLLHMTFGDAL